MKNIASPFTASRVSFKARSSSSSVGLLFIYLIPPCQKLSEGSAVKMRNLQMISALGLTETSKSDRDRTKVIILYCDFRAMHITY